MCPSEVNISGSANHFFFITMFFSFRFFRLVWNVQRFLDVSLSLSSREITEMLFCCSS
ncbi:hypothetical protein RND71_035102 [Anisodus tanguticus]|uniref:Uncharacterized protein n=1 Tax=Anisodus tanguticus TaxID=243964 RepID=A0AAE1R4D4_9SOLA|nr:hypothetical protein RND71_035102 [Anisodus tanguticus]